MYTILDPKSTNVRRSVLRQSFISGVLTAIFVTIYSAAAAQWSGSTTPIMNEVTQYSYTKTSTWGSTVNWSGTMGQVVSQWLSGDRLTAYATIRWIGVGPQTLTVKNGTLLISSLAVEVQCPTMYAPSVTVRRVSDNVISNSGCVNASFQITASPGSGGTEVYWYNTPDDVTPFQTGTSLTTGALTAGRTYWVSTYYFTGGGVSMMSMETQSAGMQSLSGAALRPPPGGGTEIKCESGKIAVTLSIYPVPEIYMSVETPTLCSGSLNQIFLSTQGGLGSSVTTNWWASYPSGMSGGAGSGTNRVEEILTLQHLINQPQNVTYYASATANGCTSTTTSSTVTVIPIPNAAASAQAICTGESTSISISTPKGVPNTTYTWTASASNASGSAAGSGSVIAQQLTNTSANNGTVTYTITPKVGWCAGSPVNVVATVKPRPVLGISNTTPSLCSDSQSSISLSNNGVAGTTYSWTATPSSVTGASSGSGSAILQTLSTSNASGGSVSYAISSSANGCAGTSGNTSITVKPKPTASANTQTLCSGLQTAISITNPNGVAGTTFNWSPTSVSNVTGASSGSGTSIVQTLTATTTTQGSLNYSIVPAANGCTGPTYNAPVYINPNPALPGGSDVVTQTTAPVLLTATGAAGSEDYRWYATSTSTPHIGTGATFTTQTLVGTFTSYFVSKKNTSTGCEGQRKEIKAVYSPPAPLSGDNPVYTGVPFYLYTFSGDWSLANAQWSITNGEILTESHSADWYTRTVRVRWTAPGPGEIKLMEGTWIHANKVVTVMCTVPGAPTLSGQAVWNGSQFVSVPNGSCGPATIQLTASPGTHADMIVWYETETGGTGVESLSISTNGTIASTKPYWIISKNLTSGCLSTTRIPVQAVVNPVPAGVPTVVGNGRFGEGELTLSASGTPSGGSYRWVNNVTGSSELNLTYTTPFLYTDQTNYVSVRKVGAEGCDGPALSVDIDVESLPAISCQDPYITHGLPVVLTATSGYDSYAWKNAGGENVGSGPVLNIATPGDYYVVVTKTGITGTGSSPSQKVALQLDDIHANYINESVLTQEVTDRNAIANLPIGVVDEKVKYFDGLGRLIQTVHTQASPSHKDVVLPAVYDPFGRQQYDYLPFTTGSNGRFKMGIINEETHAYEGVAAGFYAAGSDNNIADDDNPYAVTRFGKSPLKQVLKNGAYGEAWQPSSNDADLNDHTIKMQYSFNDENEVILWSYDRTTHQINASVSGLVKYYEPNQLQVTRTFDENNREVIHFTDKSGRLVLKKAQAVDAIGSVTSINYAETYYVYDALDNLVTVIPPAGSEQLSEYHNGTAEDRERFLNRWAFRYKYDAAERLISKKAPGSSVINMVYDDRDRLVLTQDGNQRREALPYWLFTKYDAHNRPVSTGKYYTADTVLTTMQNTVNTYYANLTPQQERFETYVGSIPGNVAGYTNKSFPQVSAEADYFTVMYHDRHDTGNTPSGYEFVSQMPEQSGHHPRVTGLRVGTLTKRLDTNTWLRKVHYYDEKYRPILSITEHPDGKIFDAAHYGFSDRLLKSIEKYVIGGNELKLQETFMYDHAGRLMEKRQRLNESAEVITFANRYNELGELITKKLHSSDNGTTFKQHVDYRYTIRKWLNRINRSDLAPDETNEPADYFGLELSYDEMLTSGNQPQFNGNISAARWNSEIAGKQNVYNYEYDALNRITNAVYKSTLNGSAWNVDVDAYNSSVTYDLNGNILSLKRSNGKPRLLDDLAYSYSGNRLQYVDDSGDRNNGFIEGNFYYDDLAYDPNGNMTQDLNRGITDATYNFFNLPDQIVSENGDVVKFIYDANGNKLAQEVYDDEAELVERTAYLGHAAVSDGAITSVSHDDGQIIAGAGGSFEYQYNLDDNTGNTRIVFTTKTDIDTTVATFETDHLQYEVPQFKNHTRVNNDLFDHTDGGTTYSYSQRLLGGSNSVIGVGKSIEVMAGDSIRVKAYAKYFDPSGSVNHGFIDVAAGLIAAFSIPVATVGEFGTYNAVNDFFSNGPAILNSGTYTWEDDEAPKAYLNILVFNKNHEIVDFAFDQIDGDADQPFGDPVKHDHDELSLNIKIHEPGYVFVYVSNENPNMVEVYFDDLMVAHRHSDVIQRDDYYPFGVSISETAYQKNNTFYKGSSYANRFGFKDLGFRRFDPYTGRFFNPDPLADMQFDESPYQYAKNNPIGLIDAWGLISSTTSAGEKSTDELRTARQADMNITSNLGDKLRTFWQKLKHSVKKLFGGNVRGNYFNSADGPRVKRGKRNGGDKTKPTQQSSGQRHDYDDYPKLARTNSLMPPDDENSRDEDRKNPNRGNSDADWNNNRGQKQDIDHNKRDGNKNKFDDPLTRKLNDQFENPGMKDIDAENDAVKQGGPVLATQLQKLNSEEKAKVHQDQSNLNWKEKANEILVIVDKVKQAIADEATSLNVTNDLRELESDDPGPVISLITYAGRLQIGDKQVEIELDVRGNLILPNSPFVITPRPAVKESTFAFSRSGKFVEYEFQNAEGQYHQISITVPKEDANDFEEYLGISTEMDKFLAEILPGDLSAEQKDHYALLLEQAKTEEGLNSTVTPDDWETDQWYTYKNQTYASFEYVVNDKGEEVKVSAEGVGERPLECWDATAVTVSRAGYQSGTYQHAYQVSMEDKDENKLIYDNAAVKRAIKSILDHLEAGRPVQVGVNYKWKGGYNKDLSTDHWITITKMKFDPELNQYYFEYYEPGTNEVNKTTTGTNGDRNRIYIVEKDGETILKGTHGPPGGGSVTYEITCVRPNGDFPDKTDTIDQSEDLEENGDCETIKCK